MNSVAPMSEPTPPQSAENPSQLVVDMKTGSEHPGAVETSPEPPKKKQRIYYIDKLRTFLTLLVVIHHCFWVVISETGWFPLYRPWVRDVPTLVLSYMILSGNQAYFMGMFFYLAGYVTGPSLKRKGTWLFLKDRFLRLVIPVIIYECLLFPLLLCFTEATWYGPQRGETASFGESWNYYWRNYVFVNNHMWFLLTLFAFSLVTAQILSQVKSWREIVFSSQPMKTELSTKQMLIMLCKLAALLVVLNFLLRIPFPSGYLWIPVWGNLGFLMQYVVVFICGILSNSYQFLDQIKIQHLRWTLPISLVLYFLFQLFQTFMIMELRASLSFYGQTFFNTLFEQFYAVLFGYSLLALFKQYANAQPSPFFQRVIEASYATYIIHQWIIIPLAIGLAYTNLHPLLVIFILCLTAPELSWAVGMLLKAIPGADWIL